MDKCALITGASSGIGYEISKIFARNGFSLILVARNQVKLTDLAEELKKDYGINCRVIVKDLTHPNAAREIYEELGDSFKLDVLVNNAGVGVNGEFKEIPWKIQHELIALNVTSLTYLCKLFGTNMVKRKSGKILNVASTAGFQAGPYMSTYYASKAYVILLSEGLNAELRKSGVTVTALCPGPTKTDFFNRADMNGTKLAASLWEMSAENVAQAGFDGLMKGKAIIIPGLMNKLLNLSIRFSPRAVTTLITEKLNKK